MQQIMICWLTTVTWHFSFITLLQISRVNPRFLPGSWGQATGVRTLPFKRHLKFIFIYFRFLFISYLFLNFFCLYYFSTRIVARIGSCVRWLCRSCLIWLLARRRIAEEDDHREDSGLRHDGGGHADRSF